MNEEKSPDGVLSTEHTFALMWSQAGFKNDIVEGLISMKTDPWGSVKASLLLFLL